MSNFVEVIRACEEATGAGTKNAIRAALSKADATAQKLIHYAMDPFRVFGVRKYEMPKEGTNCTMSQVKYDKFFEICDKLAARELTGDAGRAAVTEAIGLFPRDAHEYIARIFDKDLKAGFSADTFNKIHKTNKIPTFEVMLADKCDSPEEFLERITFPCQADHKYDGCLSASWTIELKDGRTVTIGEFVDGQMEGEVLSYNVTTKKKEWKKIEARVKNSMPERTYEWFRLTLEDGTVLPPLTGNHRIWLPDLKCWRRVDELQVNDVILTNKSVTLHKVPQLVHAA
jgi:hypothetical protein